MTYNGKKEIQKADVIDSETIVDFFTGQVVSVSGNVVEVNSGGWIPFTQNMELLSGNYTFKYADNSKATYTIEAGFFNQIDSFISKRLSHNMGEPLLSIIAKKTG